MATDDVYILGIVMTKFGKHPDKDTVDLASEAVMGALKDAGVSMADMGILAAGCLMGQGGIGQQIQKQIGQQRPIRQIVDREQRRPLLALCQR